MERDGPLHRASLWVAGAIVAVALLLAGYAALAQLMRMPAIP